MMSVYGGGLGGVMPPGSVYPAYSSPCLAPLALAPSGPPSCQPLPSNLISSVPKSHMSAMTQQPIVSSAGGHVMVSPGPFGEAGGRYGGGPPGSEYGGMIPPQVPGPTAPHSAPSSAYAPHHHSQSNQVYVFFTNMANDAADAVNSGQYQSIVHWHKDYARARTKNDQIQGDHLQQQQRLNHFGATPVSVGPPAYTQASSMANKFCAPSASPVMAPSTQGGGPPPSRLPPKAAAAGGVKMEPMSPGDLGRAASSSVPSKPPGPARSVTPVRTGGGGATSPATHYASPRSNPLPPLASPMSTGGYTGPASVTGVKAERSPLSVRTPKTPHSPALGVTASLLPPPSAGSLNGTGQAQGRSSTPLDSSGGPCSSASAPPPGSTMPPISGIATTMTVSTTSSSSSANYMTTSSSGSTMEMSHHVMSSVAGGGPPGSFGGPGGGSLVVPSSPRSTTSTPTVTTDPLTNLGQMFSNFEKEAYNSQPKKQKLEDEAQKTREEKVHLIDQIGVSLGLRQDDMAMGMPPGHAMGGMAMGMAPGQMGGPYGPNYGHGPPHPFMINQHGQPAHIITSGHQVMGGGAPPGYMTGPRGGPGGPQPMSRCPVSMNGPPSGMPPGSQMMMGPNGPCFLTSSSMTPPDQSNPHAMAKWQSLVLQHDMDKQRGGGGPTGFSPGMPGNPRGALPPPYRGPGGGGNQMMVMGPGGPGQGPPQGMMMPAAGPPPTTVALKQPGAKGRGGRGRGGRASAAASRQQLAAQQQQQQPMAIYGPPQGQDGPQMMLASGPPQGHHPGMMQLPPGAQIRQRLQGPPPPGHGQMMPGPGLPPGHMLSFDGAGGGPPVEMMGGPMSMQHQPPGHMMMAGGGSQMSRSITPSAMGDSGDFGNFEQPVMFSAVLNDADWFLQPGSGWNDPSSCFMPANDDFAGVGGFGGDSVSSASVVGSSAYQPPPCSQGPLYCNPGNNGPVGQSGPGDGMNLGNGPPGGMKMGFGGGGMPRPNMMGTSQAGMMPPGCFDMDHCGPTPNLGGPGDRKNMGGGGGNNAGGPRHQQAGPTVNNTYVNATMHVQQMNIQNVPGSGPFPMGPAPASTSMNIQQTNMHNTQQQFVMQAMDSMGAAAAGCRGVPMPQGGPQGRGGGGGPPNVHLRMNHPHMAGGEPNGGGGAFMGGPGGGNQTSAGGPSYIPSQPEPITNLESKVPTQKLQYFAAADSTQSAGAGSAPPGGYGAGAGPQGGGPTANNMNRHGASLSMVQNVTTMHQQQSQAHQNLQVSHSPLNPMFSGPSSVPDPSEFGGGGPVLQTVQMSQSLKTGSMTYNMMSQPGQGGPGPVPNPGGALDQGQGPPPGGLELGGQMHYQNFQQQLYTANVRRTTT